MKKYVFLFVFLITSIICFSQIKFRSGILLHHSTGEMIWGPNGSSTSIPQEMSLYNTSHLYTGADSVSMNEFWWPTEPRNNEWVTWHAIFENEDALDIRPFLLTDVTQS